MTAAMQVLVVEDEMILAMDIEAMVEDSGHHILAEAASLKDVERLPPEIKPDLALVDLHLADNSDGLQVSRLIQDRWPKAIIIFVTANTSKIPDDFAGAHGVIGKPFSHSGIINALKYVAEGVFDPPPATPKPSSLIISPNLKRRWAEV